MKTNKEKAIAHVREVCTELVEAINEPPTKIVKNYGHGSLIEEKPARCYFKHHTPNLQHFLRGMEKTGDWDCHCKIEDGIIKLFASSTIITYNLTLDGNNQDPTFYDEYVSICDL